jgi:hypothetical protein
MRHFLYFENGGPFPGTCISCGDTKHLYDIQGTRLDGGNNLLCKKCVGELAEFAGYAELAPLEEQIYNLKADIEAHERELARIPDHVEDLINGIRSRITDFVFAVSYGDSISDAESAEKPELSVEQSDEHAQRQHADSGSRNKPTRK